MKGSYRKKRTEKTPWEREEKRQGELEWKEVTERK